LSARYIVKTYSLLTTCDDSGVPCCCARDYEKVFGRRAAERDARRFRRRGLRGSARDVRELAGDVHGATVLEVGGGVGAIELELLADGAAAATNVELSAEYEEPAAELAAERGVAGRVERRVGDFVEASPALLPHDVVVLHRVVCCYPDVDALVGAAAERARRRMVLTYPQDRRLLRALAATANRLLKLRRSTFRVYVHPVTRIEAIAGANGLALERRRRRGLVWESAVFARAS
jgi:2-polyprenyl-3-methyl-5-hydroxy-6-metoxy-1,4-benzoquinol methylase